MKYSPSHVEGFHKSHEPSGTPCEGTRPTTADGYCRPCPLTRRFGRSAAVCAKHISRSTSGGKGRPWFPGSVVKFALLRLVFDTAALRRVDSRNCFSVFIF